MQQKPQPSQVPKSLYNIDATGKRHRIYPQDITGKFTRIRTKLAYLLILIYLLPPWLKINGLPVIQLNIPDRQFVLFGSIFWPQDVQYLVFIFILAGLFLFFITALLGRVWCGWACPQTIFLEFVLRRIEYWIEGNRTDQIKLDKSPWTPSKFTKKAIKHLLFLLVAAVVSNTFLAYFTGVDSLLQWISSPPWENWTAFLFMLFFLFAFYFDLAHFQEQYCILVCPYARFQSALIDSQTIQVMYDPRRGEPRGRRSKVTGDCIDCSACIRACPTGIDIRNGSQLECIGCTRCIDACDRIMTRIKKPKGLIRYESELGLAGEKPSVISAILKYHSTELARNIGMDAMDIHGGKAVMLGPKNYLAGGYESTPVGITVEGANIMTRSLII
ncbi:MAG: cytochrome c oxidase accessory protein CcoG, partial [Deltaproteobacteria bacterium]|nr:cytochrome c oxidase accessory protein CcoG [Deltaproteobacteria bacterium]